MPGYSITGFEYSAALQPYHVEVWVEKSTMDEILVPICREFGVNLVTGVGFFSITAVNELIKRAARHDKPVRILYISDFDPAGDKMPAAVARQIEFWLKYHGLDKQVKLNPLALTREQVKNYRLPEASHY